ncbi:hypothetical protein [Methylobacterium haplocladii]|uniref:Spermidine synthase n=1 Tax=Methylobacterium haplocladii TaxID=1176176 RepID=A0A512IV99_9HYPH|nr:hypothetical protein [Methylobacterium haplocladii]GEP01606.1 spermidine synthase [Methylobacterium haplocladii]GJD86376.1 Polyamine aminopropyltransferase [Methylobacterium haplocladii]GLS61454.1 spermidine synthase [Methylobacterium haplocladii]
MPDTTAWTEIDVGAVPGTPDTMRLMRRSDGFTIMVGTCELMSDLFCASEKALATIACERLRDRPTARMLIGGLGMGFTLGAALDGLGPEASVVVSELVPSVAAWARGPLSHLFAGSLDDPRVAIRVEDVNRSIQAAPAAYDAILLDVDNGPEGATRRANDRLYDAWGLKRARWALRPGGILAVWSGHPDRKFKARLRRTGFSVEEIRIRSNVTDGRRHVLWIATRVEDAG